MLVICLRSALNQPLLTLLCYASANCIDHIYTTIPPCCTKPSPFQCSTLMSLLRFSTYVVYPEKVRGRGFPGPNVRSTIELGLAIDGPVNACIHKRLSKHCGGWLSGAPCWITAPCWGTRWQRGAQRRVRGGARWSYLRHAAGPGAR